jgi:competence protein ComGC
MKIGIALLLLVVTVARAADDAEKGCRARLKNLGGATKAYQIIHDKRPAKISDLYSDGLVNSLDDFICPASGTTIKVASEIDSKSDYTLEPLPDAKDMVVREKTSRHGANTVLAIFADNSIKALPPPGGSTAAVTPTTGSPTPAPKTSPPIQPSPTADSGLVVVPNLALFGTVSKMKAELERLGLVGSFSAKGKPPSKAFEFKFASQMPLADTKVKPGTKVEVFIYQKFEETTSGVTTNPSTAASTTPATQGDEVVVPNLAQFDTVSKMKAALERVGLRGHFVAKGKPPSRESEFKFASQVPVANARVKRDTLVAVFIYQKFEESSGPPTTYSPSSSPPPAKATPPAATSSGFTRRDSGDPTSNLEGAKWIGSWRGKVMRTGEPIAGGDGPNEEEYTLIRRRDGSDVWINGSTPLSWYEVGNGKIRFKMKNTTPPQYAELEQRGDHWAGRWVAGDKVLATFDLAPIPKPNWLSHM